MKLTPEQIAFVKQFIVSKKYIYIEEQVEILDHFISLLEDAKTKDSIDFESLVGYVYEENKVELISIQKSVKRSLKKRYNSMLYKNILAHFSIIPVSIYLFVSFLYYLYLAMFKDDLSSLMIYIPFYVSLILSTIGYKRTFEVAKGKYLTTKYASTFLWYGIALNVLPGSIILSLGNRFGINLDIICAAMALAFMFEIVLFRAFIRTVLSGAVDCKRMEENYRLTN